MTYRTDGGPSGEVLLRRLSGAGTPWYVVAAASDLRTYDQVVQDGAAVLRVTSELGGTVSYEVRDAAGDVVLEGAEPVTPRTTVVLGAGLLGDLVSRTSRWGRSGRPTRWAARCR